MFKRGDRVRVDKARAKNLPQGMENIFTIIKVPGQYGNEDEFSGWFDPHKPLSRVLVKQRLDSNQFLVQYKGGRSKVYWGGFLSLREDDEYYRDIFLQMKEELGV